MTLKHPTAQRRHRRTSPSHRCSASRRRRFRARASRRELPPDVAYQIIHDELMLDGNAAFLNVATFVSTWMEPQAERLMAECVAKNMIDKDEYLQTAEIELRCVNILSTLARARGGRGDWLLDDGIERGGDARRAGIEATLAAATRSDGRPADRPNIADGDQRPGVLEKFANYWDVEMRLVPMDGDRYNLSAEEAVRRCDENTIGVVAILGSTFAPTSRSRRFATPWMRSKRKRHVPVHVDGASGAMIAPVPRPGPRGISAPPCRLDQHVGPQVRARHPGVGWIVWRTPSRPGRSDLLGQLPRRHDAHCSRSTSRGPALRSLRSTTTSCGSASRATAGCRVRARCRHSAVRADRRARAVRAADARGRAPGLRFHAERRRRQLHGLRRLQCAAGARLACPRVHVPGEQDRSGCASWSARLHTRPR